MTDQSELQNLQKVLKKYGQTCLLAFWDRLDPARQARLFAQIGQLDFIQLDQWRTEFVMNTAPFKLPGKLSPAPFYAHSRAMPASEANTTRRVNWVTS